MKKKILIISIIILIVIITFMIYLLKVNYKKNNDEIFENTPNSASEVLSVEMTEETEGGYVYYKTEEKELIEKIVKALNEIEIKEKTDIAISDDIKTYKLKLANGTILTYCFQNKYYHKDNMNYEMSNYQDLMKLKIPKINEK